MSTAESARPGNEYRKDIDGLRAVAILAVVLYHAGVNAVRGGFVGVDIFFVISGYLIGAHVYREVAEGRFSLARFYQRRAKRILPALLAVIAFVYAAGALLMSPMELNRTGRFAGMTVLSVSNVYAWLNSGYFDARTVQVPLIMTWSLGVEEQFYVFFPLLMLLFGWYARRGERQRSRMPSLVLATMVAAIVLTLMLCIGETHHDASGAFYLIPFRAWELAVGVWMAVHEARPGMSYGESRVWEEVRGAAGLAAMVAAVLLFGVRTMFPGPGAVLPVVGAALVLSAPGSWVNRRVLSWGPMRGVGLVSYSWYLWHWPLLSFATLALGASLQVPVGVGVFAVTLALLPAWLSYRFVEQPFRRSRRAPGPLLRRYGVACLVMLLPPVALVLSHGWPQRYPAQGMQDEAILRQVRPCISFTRAVVMSEDCLPQPDGRPAVAVLGDSHGSVLVPRMRELAGAAGMRVVAMFHSSCAPLVGVVRHEIEAGFDARCIDYNREALRWVTGDTTVTTVYLAGLWDGPLALDAPEDRGYMTVDASGAVDRRKVSAAESDANLERGLTAMVRTLHAAGKRVVLVQDVESFQFEPSLRARSVLIPARRGLATALALGRAPTLAPARGNEMFAQENLEEARIVAAVGAREGAEVLDLRSKLCDAEQCAWFADGTLLYADANHLSTAGVARVLQGVAIR